MKRCTQCAVGLCLVAFLMVSGAESFNFESYLPGELDEIVKQPRPKEGVDVFKFKKVRITVTLMSYAEEKCPVAGLVKMVMVMLPTVYPEGIRRSVSMGKCIRVKSSTGTEVTMAIQDRVADFLPEEVPIGKKVNLYCIVMGVTAEGPLMLVNEFQALSGGDSPGKERKIGGRIQPGFSSNGDG